MTQNRPVEQLPDHPAIWRGSELQDRSDFLMELTDTEIGELKAAIQTGDGDPVHQASQFPLNRLGEKLASVQHSLEQGSGAVIIRGLPVQDFSEVELRQIFAGMMSHVGSAVSQSAAGETIFSVRNEGFGKQDARTRGPNTSNRLSFHTDRCDVISFLCIQQAKLGGDNYVVSSMALYNEISERRPDLIEVLKEPFYYKRHNVDSGNQKAFIQQPIFSIFEGHFAANLLRVLINRAYESPEIEDMTDLQREALDFVEELAEDPSLHFQFRQQPGDIVLLNNFVTLHRRDEFEDYDEIEKRRHLLRIWLSVPNNRPLHPLFSGNYGATSAGAIRGGMKPVEDQR